MTTGIPVITIDGPGGAGKGTIGRSLAKRLGFHFLDSGALYRLLALKVVQGKLDEGNESALVKAALQLELPSEDEALRSEVVGNTASRVAAMPAVREALLARQRAAAIAPGLVADGRDMGTVVFPHANLKLFLTASATERAARRFQELRNRGLNVTLAGLLLEIEERDQRDQNRAIAPLKPAADGVIIDTTGQDIQEVFETVLEAVRARGLLIA